MKKRFPKVGFNCVSSSILAILFACQAVDGENYSPNWERKQNEERFNQEMDPLRGALVPGRYVKVGNIADISGDESVMLNGFGIVSGLNGTGDNTAAAAAMLMKVASSQGIQLSPADIKGKNLAVVSISAEVHPHQKNFDIAVKSIGNAKSLQNGFLEASTLSPIGSKEIYAVASGALSLGGRYFETNSGGRGANSSVTIGHPTVGFVISGGELVQSIPSNRVVNSKLRLSVKHPDERTSMNIAKSINSRMGMLGIVADPISASVVEILLPEYYLNSPGRVTELVADINDLPTIVSRRAMITIDQGSGVIAMTGQVKMEPGSITVSGITVSVSAESRTVPKGGLLGGNDTVNDASLEVSQKNASFLAMLIYSRSKKH
jgi:flagellar P-ring protein precursor FlgI